jgi:Flp pilus assembly protein TadD
MVLRLANLRKNTAETQAKLETIEKERKNFQTLFNKKNEECELLYADLKKLRNNPKADEATKQLNKENDSFRKENQLLTAKVDNLFKENNKLKQELSISENKFKGLNSTLAFVEKERKELKVQIKNTEEQLAKQTKDALELRNKMAELEKTAHKSSSELKAFAEKYKELQGRIDSKDTLALKNFSFVKKNKDLQDELTALSKKSAETEKKLSAITESKTKLEKTLGELSLKNKKTLDEHAKLKTNHDNLKLELENLNKEKTALLNVREHNKRLFAETKSSKSQLETIKKEISKTQEALQKKDKAVSELIAEVGKYRELNKTQADKIIKLENQLKEQKVQNKKVAGTAQPKTSAPPKKLPKNSIQVASNGDSGMPLESQRETKDKEKKNKYPVEKNDKTAAPGDEKLGLKNTISGRDKKVDQDTIKFLLQSGKKSETKKDLEAAIWHYRKASQMDPENFEAQKCLGAAYLAKGDSENAVISLEKAKDLKDDDVEALLLLGKAYMASGKNRSALSALNKAALLDKKNPEAQRCLGILCKNIGRHKFAEEKLRKALEFDPKSPETTIELAKLLAFSFKGKEIEAVELYEKALELGAKPDPALDKLYENPQVKNRKKIKKEKIDAKKTSTQKKNELKKKKPLPEIKAKKEVSKTDGKKKITKAVQENLDDQTLEFLINSASESEKNKNFEKADWFYNKAAKVSPNSPLPFKKQAEMYTRLKNEYKAMIAYEKSKQIFNGDTEVLIPLASIYIKQGKYQEAINILNTAAILDPKNPTTYRKLGEVCRNLQKREQAERSLLKSFELDPKSKETALLLTKLYTYTYKNRLEDGKKWYNTAKELGATPDESLEAFYRKK